MPTIRNPTMRRLLPSGSSTKDVLHRLIRNLCQTNFMLFDFARLYLISQVSLGWCLPRSSAFNAFALNLRVSTWDSQAYSGVCQKSFCQKLTATICVQSLHYKVFSANQFKSPTWSRKLQGELRQNEIELKELRKFSAWISSWIAFLALKLRIHWVQL